jgi:DNA-binding transcriptional regulator PaaX
MSSQNEQHGRKILKKLAEKPILPTSDIAPSGEYALKRAVKNLVLSGHIEKLQSDRQDYLRLTKKGKMKLNSLMLEGVDTLVPASWDGFWRIIILDLPEDRKNERESLRYLLKKANFVCIKNTVWISPLPYENLFINIKKDLGLSTELMVIVTDKIDEDTKIAFLNAIKNQ